MNGDTIVAPSTSLAGGAVRALVRLSGPRAHELARASAGEGVEVLCLLAPRTYTREPMAELRLPGCAPLVEALVERLCAAGARVAAPGEFTFRAFVNGRIDLARAEAVLAVIRARDDDERLGGLRALAGGLSKRLNAVEEGLLDLCAEVEAGIDFVDQDIEIVSAEEIGRRGAGLLEGLRGLRRRASVQASPGDELRVLLFGRANVGKSTLFNRLVPGADAIVSDRPGTTRDLLEGRVAVEGMAMPVTLVDSAGILERAEGLEAAVVRRTHEAIKGVDLVVHVLDATQPGPDGLEPKLQGIRALTIVNKVDAARAPSSAELGVSARTGEGLDALRRRLAEILRERLGGGEARFCLSLRQSAALRAAEYLLSQALDAARGGRGIELVAADLRDAACELGSVTGRQVTVEVLGRIFSRFCIGK